MAHEVEIAWAAGLFEGEGSITIQRSGDRGRLRVRFTLAMTDEDVVRRFQCILGCGSVYGPKMKKGATKPQWTYYVGRPEQIQRIAGLFRPYLGERRLAKLDECLSAYSAQPPRGNWQREKTHCPRGHEYTEENTVRYPSQYARRCKTCEREQGKRALLTITPNGTPEKASPPLGPTEPNQ